MKKIVSIIVIFSFKIVFFPLCAQTPVWQWEKKMGGFYGDGANSMALDNHGNVYTTGSEGGSADFDPGPLYYYLSPFQNGTQNTFISKLDSAGNFVWAKSIGTQTILTKGNGIALDASGNVYIAGEFADTLDIDPDSLGTFTIIPSGLDDIFILKLDSGGNFIWARHMGGSDVDAPAAIAIDGAGNIYTTGYFRDTVDFDPDSATVYNMVSAGYHDIFISKLDSAGNFIWAKQMSGTNGEEAKSLAVDAEGNVYTTGWIDGTTDFDPGAGTANLTTRGVEDIFVSKLDSAGNFMWAKSVGGTNQDIGESIDVDGRGNVYITGGFTDTVDFDPGVGVTNLIAPTTYNQVFILKLNSNGELIWAKSMGGDYSDFGQSVFVDSEANVYSTGWFTSNADFNPDTSAVFLLVDPSTYWTDVFVSKLDSSGNFIWAKSINGTASDLGFSLKCDIDGNLLIAGGFASPVLMFDSIPLANTGASASDVWVAKLNNNIYTTVPEASLSHLKLSVYPNPATSLLSINTTHLSGPSEIKIFNVLGEMVLYSEIRTGSYVPQVSLDISSLINGIYWIVAGKGNQISGCEFIKQ